MITITIRFSNFKAWLFWLSKSHGKIGAYSAGPIVFVILLITASDLDGVGTSFQKLDLKYN